jgi:ABC-type uncharacterized transport system ATPase subunit
MEKELKQIESMQKALDVLKDIKWVEAEMYVADINAYINMRKEKLLTTLSIKELPEIPKPEAKLPERAEEMLDEQFDELMKQYESNKAFYEEYNPIIDGIVEAINDLTIDEATTFTSGLNKAIQKTKAKIVGDKTVSELGIELPSVELIKSRYAQSSEK